MYIFSEEALQNEHKRVEEINYDLMTYLIAIVIEYHYSQRITFQYKLVSFLYVCSYCSNCKIALISSKMCRIPPK